MEGRIEADQDLAPDARTGRIVNAIRPIVLEEYDC